MLRIVICNVLYRRKVLLQTDVRIKFLNELLTGIRVVKFYAWEEPLIEKITDVRWQELKLLRKMAYVISVFFTFALGAAPFLMEMLVFITFSLQGNQLTAAIVFTTLVGKNECMY